MQQDYLEKVYAGFLGMNIGIRLGAPVEPTIWTYERIRDTYGDITGYVKDYKNFAADDDANGPVYFLRALYDKPGDAPVTPGDVADAWLNYAREGVGMFWWGGYGVSTEHTAYLNLKQGIPAPQSGSMAQNGKTLAEQIGGQIFIDTWGLISPGQPKLAADLGENAASVSHDGEGIWGARFFCAAIAKAFTTGDINEIVAAGLAEVPANSLYARVAAAVQGHHESNPADWRSCHDMLVHDWGYDRYPGVCHMIPNAGVCFMALLYGAGDFARTVEIATMAGWDTDCNAGNVGTVLGVANGLNGIPAHYREPVNDFLVLSGISGYLNILDIPTYAREVALLGYRQAGEQPPAELAQGFRPGEIYFDFALPGSTHGMRLSDEFFCRTRHTVEDGEGALEILVDRMSRGDRCKVFYKPFYQRSDFSDERYMPVFSPTVYPGQVLRARLKLDLWNGWETPGIAPYIRCTHSGKELPGGFVKLVDKEWVELEYTLPDTHGDMIDEVGFIIEGYSIAKAKTLGRVLLGELCISGPARYTIDVAKQCKAFGAITPFSFDGGARDIEGDKITHMRCGPAFAYAGNYYAGDVEIEASLVPHTGGSHLLLTRSRGALWGYAAGFTAPGKAGILANNKGYTTLIEVDYTWKQGEEYRLLVRAQGNCISLYINGEKTAEARDSANAYGMYGFGSCEMGRTSWWNFRIKEL